MVDVNLVYNAYQNSMRILADGQPLNNVSSLTRYQSLPFLAWCGEILPKLANEVNDEYCLTYVGRGCESRILVALSAKYPSCRSLHPQSPTIADSTAKRLRKLNQLCMSGLPYSQFTQPLLVFSDYAKEELESFFKGTFPKMCFCRIRIQYKSLEELAGVEPDDLCFIIAHDANEAKVDQLLNNQNSEAYVLLTSSVSEFIGINGSRVVEKTTPDLLPNVIGQYLELSFLMQVLRKAMSLVSVDEKDINYQSFAALDKIEPQTYAQIPSTIEMGQSLSIKLYTVPEGYTPNAVQYRISNPDIVQIRNNTIVGVGTGEAVVEVYQAGQSVCIGRQRIIAHKRNRITSLHLRTSVLRLCVGDKVKLEADYEPRNADNTATIRYLSDDGLVASAIDGVVTARRPGSTSIRVTTDNRVSDVCRVEVFPKLEDIKLSLSSSEMAFNGIVDVTVKRVPENATLDELVYTIEPPNIAVFDRAGMKLAAREAGPGKLIVRDKRRSVRKEVGFEIKQPPMDKSGLIKFAIGALFVIALLVILFH